MPRISERDPKLMFYLGLIRAAGRLVPGPERDEWRREWQAEVEFRRRQVRAWEKSSGRAERELFRRCMQAFADAVAFRAETLNGGTLVEDFSGGLLALAQTPLLTAKAVLTLTVGVAALGLMFGLSHALLFRPLPYADADRLVFVRNTFVGIDWKPVAVSAPEIVAYRERGTSFEGFAASRLTRATATDGRRTFTAATAIVTPNFFSLSGAVTLHGRPEGLRFNSEELGKTVVVGENVWRRELRSDPSVVGRSITINGEPCRVVGVLPADFTLPENVEIWLPKALDAGPFVPESYGQRDLQLIGKLKPRVSLETAREELSAVSQVVHGGPNMNYPPDSWGIDLERLRERTQGGFKHELPFLLAVAVLGVVTAWAGLVAFLENAAERRSRKFNAVAPGDRRRDVRRLNVGSLTVLVAGSVLGGVTAQAGFHFLRAAAPRARMLQAAGIDGVILPPMLGALVFVFIAAWWSARPSAVGANATRMSGGRLGRRLVPLAVQGCAAALLSVGAAWAFSAHARLESVDLGADIENVWAFRFTPPQTDDSNPARLARLYDAGLERLKTLRGLESVSLVNIPPGVGVGSSRSVIAEGGSPQALRNQTCPERRIVGPEYFRVLRIPFVEGRTFTSPGQVQTPEVVVNRAFAEIYWPGESALGKRIKSCRSDDSSWSAVVGVVGNVRQSLTAEARPEFYVPYFQDPAPSSFVVARMAVGTKPPASDDPFSLAEYRLGLLSEILPPSSDVPELGARLSGIAPLSSARRPVRLRDMLAEQLAEKRIVVMLLAIFAGCAVLSVLLEAVHLVQSTEPPAGSPPQGFEIGDFMRKNVKALLILLFTMTVLGFGTPVFAGQNRSETDGKAAPSDAADQTSAQFDFWVGTWTVSGPGSAPFTDKVKAVVKGAAMLETWKAPNGRDSGSSVTVYDSRTGTWTQTYKDTSGLYLQATGKFENNEIVMIGDADTGDGRIRVGRLIYRNITRNGFDQRFEISNDGGKTFQFVGETHWAK